MPGIVEVPNRRKSTSDHKVAGDRPSPPSSSHSPPHRDDSYQPPYPFRTITTAYGVNGPQWSVGPPPIIYEYSPYARVPLPPMSRTPARINEILAYDPNPRIEWAVNQHPRQAMCASLSVTPTQYHWQSQPAIEPHSVRSITIRLKPFDRDRPIVVLPTQGVMTVGEVLHAVYSGARAGATEMFCNASGVLPLLMESRLSDYSQLAIHSSGPKMGEDEVSSDVCSCLNFKTRWAGLTPSTTESDVWILHTLPIS